MSAIFRRRFLAELAISLLLHAVLLSQVRRAGFDISNLTEKVTIRHEKIVKWIVPSPKPIPTPLPRWSQLDRSMLKHIRLTPADEQIVVLAARQGNGAPSKAPHILRVDIRPGVVHQDSTMHIRVLTDADCPNGAEGVYVRFVLWEVAVPPAGGFRLPASDAYQVEVIATGAQGIAAGAYVPVRVL